MRATDGPIPVLVTAIGGGGHGDQILKALRCAAPGRYRLLGADANPHCPQFSLVEKSFVLPMADQPDYMDLLLDICRKEGVRALFHGCEAELRLFSRERRRIEAAGILLPINPAGVIDTCMDKFKTAVALSTLGFVPPKFALIDRMDALGAVDFFPVVVKPSIGGGGSANCYIAQTPEELYALGTLLHIGDTTQVFLVQEYVGTPNDEYTVGVLHDLDGEFINSIAVHRLLKGQLSIRLSVPNRTGKDAFGPRLVISSGISQGHVDRYPGITGQCEEIARALGVRGAVNIQCRVVDGKVRAFEINPRFSGTTSIRAMKGYNEPDILLRIHLLGERVEPRFSYRAGWVLRSLAETELAEVAP